MSTVARAVVGTGQGGLVLVFSLVFMLLLALMTTAITTVNQLQMRMVAQGEIAAQSRQAALDEIELLLEQYKAVPPGIPGTVHCIEGALLEKCDSRDLSQGGSGARSGWVTVVDPAGKPPPRLRESYATSTVAYYSARYEVTAVAGQVSLTQGVLILYPGAQQ